MRKTILAALALFCLSASAHTRNLTAEDLTRRTIERRAIEAVVWGMPVVNYDLMYQAMVRDTKGTFNQIVYWSRLPDWKNQTLTPNPDSIYLMPFFNTKDAGAIHCRKCRERTWIEPVDCSELTLFRGHRCGYRCAKTNPRHCFGLSHRYRRNGDEPCS